MGVFSRGSLSKSATRTLGGAGAALLMLGTSFPARALARTTCAYAGAPMNTLTVRVSGEAVAEIKRQGIQLTVRDQGGPVIGCAGGAATVLNTDTIVVRLGDVDFVDVDLRGGPFAPGATLEGEGASEIEIEISTDLGAADIIGTAGDDEWHWGRGPHEANPALNLNPREAGDQDVDVTATREAFAAAPIIANGGGGNDTIIGAPGAKLRGVVIAHGGPGQDVLSAPAVPRGVFEASAVLLGGSGDDVVTGGQAGDRLAGGAGEDRVDGRNGADHITGGAGRDRLFGGTGRDVMMSRDYARDTVSCGAGSDRVVSDRRDAVRGCEQVRR